MPAWRPASECDVSRLSLGSWRTYERISRDEGLAVMHAARDAGITFLDDARYNDETGTAPIPTGYSEVLFGELFRAAGWQRRPHSYDLPGPDERLRCEIRGEVTR